MGNLIRDFWTYEYKTKSYFGIVEVVKGKDLAQKRNYLKYETHIEKALEYTMKNDVLSHMSIQTFCTWLKDKSERGENEQKYYPFILEFEAKKEDEYKNVVSEAIEYLRYLHSELDINKDDILIMINNNKSIYISINPKAYSLKPEVKLADIYTQMYKSIKKKLTLKYVDESIVASTYKLMKTPNTYYKGGYFVRITADELLKLLAGIITKKQLTSEKRTLDIEVPGELSFKAAKFYNKYMKKVKYGTKVKEDCTPICGGKCINYLLTHMVEKGYRNYALVSVGIYLKSLGYTKEENLKNLRELATSWNHDENELKIKSKINTIYRKNYHFSCKYAANVFSDLGIESMCSKCPFKKQNCCISENFEIDERIINQLWANGGSTRHYYMYLKLSSKQLFNKEIDLDEEKIDYRTLRELCKLTLLTKEKIEGKRNLYRIVYKPSDKIYKLPIEFFSTADQLGDALKHYLKLFVKSYKALDKYVMIRASKITLMNELGYKSVSAVYKLLDKLRLLGLIKDHKKGSYTLYYSNYKVIELQHIKEKAVLEAAALKEEPIKQVVNGNESMVMAKDNSYQMQMQMDIRHGSCGIYGRHRDVSDIWLNEGGDEGSKLDMFDEKHKRWLSRGHLKVMKGYLKYDPGTLDQWIQECKILNLSKAAVIYNSKKYGYEYALKKIIQRVFLDE